MVYADYAYYKGDYHGDTVPVEAFEAAAARASEQMDADTFCRTQQYAALAAVKCCCCALAEALYRDEKDGGAVQSETVGSWSRTYRQTKENARGLSGTIRNIELRYLATTGLLYAGV